MSAIKGLTPYVEIGTQTWQRRNLDVTTYRNGDLIPYVADATEWGSLTTGAWCWYNNDPELGKIYGKLYNGHAVADSRGLAPVGWRVPTESDFTNLVNFLGVFSGGMLKATGLTYWDSPNTGATNSSGFTALPAGQRDAQSPTFSFLYKGYQTLYWTTTPAVNSLVSYKLTADSSNGIFAGRNKIYGFSVRCIKE